MRQVSVPSEAMVGSSRPRAIRSSATRVATAQARTESVTITAAGNDASSSTNWPTGTSRTGIDRARQQDLTCVGIRRPWLGVQIVAVVPHHHEPEIVHRRIGRASRTEHDSNLTTGDAQEVAVPRRGLVRTGQHHMRIRPQGLGERLAPTFDVTDVRNAHDCSRGLVARQDVEDGAR